MIKEININKYQMFLAKKTVERDNLFKVTADLEKGLLLKQTYMSTLTEAREVMNAVASLAQDETKLVIESLVTKALQSVFGLIYSFEIETKIARNKAEMFMYVVKDGRKSDLKNELGGGVIDVVSFALRVILWAISCPRSADTIILDEPGRFIDKDRLNVFGEMIKELGKILEVQFIIVTHEEELVSMADKSFYVTQQGGITDVAEVV